MRKTQSFFGLRLLISFLRMRDELGAKLIESLKLAKNSTIKNVKAY